MISPKLPITEMKTLTFNFVWQASTNSNHPPVREPDLPCFAKETHRMTYPQIADQCQYPAPHKDDPVFKLSTGFSLYGLEKTTS
jgi:hypothetical protein